MTPMTKLLVALVLNGVIACFALVATRRSPLPDSTKTLLYIISVLVPIFGLVLVEILKRRALKNL